MQIFEFSQSTPAATWSVAHNLGCKPVFDVVVLDNGSLVKAYPAGITHVSDTLLELTFTTPRAGTARLVGTPL